MPQLTYLQNVFNFKTLILVSSIILAFCNVLLILRLQDSDVFAKKGRNKNPPRISIIQVSSHDDVHSGIATGFDLDPRLGHWDSRRLFKTFDHALVGTRFAELSANFSVSLATQTSLERIYSLTETASHWSGPISVAVFVVGDDEFRLLQVYVEYLIRCHRRIRERVTFHVTFPKQYIPSHKYNRVVQTEEKCPNAKHYMEELLKLRSMEIARWKTRFPYPQNLLRNIARKNCQTTNVFLVDVDVIPSPRLATRLDVFYKTKDVCKENCAYVVPTYELQETARFPKDKKSLLETIKQGAARPFHWVIFKYNQGATNFTRWEADTREGEILVSYELKHFQFYYEPFYVAPDTVPQHDERFIGYGFTRNTQVYEMAIAGYNFYVLSSGFTIHWGFQNKSSRPPWRVRQLADSKKNYENFMREIYARYAIRRRKKTGAHNAKRSTTADQV